MGREEDRHFMHTSSAILVSRVGRSFRWRPPSLRREAAWAPHLWQAQTHTAPRRHCTARPQALPTTLCWQRGCRNAPQPTGCAALIGDGTGKGMGGRGCHVTRLTHHSGLPSLPRRSSKTLWVWAETRGTPGPPGLIQGVPTSGTPCSTHPHRTKICQLGRGGMKGGSPGQDSTGKGKKTQGPEEAVGNPG